jgi:hypothetical protein
VIEPVSTAPGINKMKRSKPRTFAEVVAAEHPTGRALMDKVEGFEDPTVRDPFQREVSVHEDLHGAAEWRVEYFDSDGGCYVTTFAGPEAEKRARDYFDALRTRRLKTIRDRSSLH